MRPMMADQFPECHVTPLWCAPGRHRTRSRKCSSTETLIIAALQVRKSREFSNNCGILKIVLTAKWLKQTDTGCLIKTVKT